MYFKLTSALCLKVVKWRRHLKSELKCACILVDLIEVKLQGEKQILREKESEREKERKEREQLDTVKTFQKSSYTYFIINILL